MDYRFIIIVSAFTAYVSVVVIAIIGIMLKKRVSKTAKPQIKSLSVIVPFRNEAEHLHLLLKSIVAQDVKNVEFIFVDDFSDDNSVDIINHYAAELPNVKVIQATESGKKNAQKQGVKHAVNDYVLFLDADVVLPQNYFKTIFNLNIPCDLLILPVSFNLNKTIISIWSYYEQLVLTGLNLGWSNVVRPLFCNGANLLVKKSMYLDSLKERLDFTIASGDDVFLLEFAIKHKKKVTVVYQNPDLWVTTFAPNSWEKFINQHIRWTTKLKKVDVSLVHFIGFVLTIFNFSYLYLIILSITSVKYVEILTIIFFIKAMIDNLLLFLIAKKGKLEINGLKSGFISIIYPLFGSVIFLISIFKTRYTWKNRLVR